MPPHYREEAKAAGKPFVPEYGVFLGMSWITLPTVTSLVNPLPVDDDGSGWGARALNAQHETCGRTD